MGLSWGAVRIKTSYRKPPAKVPRKGATIGICDMVSEGGQHGASEEMDVPKSRFPRL